MIKCTLIEVDNDNRAIICVGEDPHGSVKRTGRLSAINYDTKVFWTKNQEYEFITADEAVELG